MIKGGSPIVYVSDLDRSVEFYTNVLGLRLQLYEPGHIAMIDCGDGLAIGLHPASPHAPAPGAKGSINICFNCDEPVEEIVARLSAQGVAFRGPIVDDAKSGMKFAAFGDLDDNELYLSRWPNG